MSGGYTYIHTGCGGEIVKRKCQRCGKDWGMIKYFIARDITDKSPNAPFDPKAYRERLRSGSDLRKNR